MAGFSPETMEVKRKWHNSFQVSRELSTHNPILSIFFRNDKEIKMFPRNLEELPASSPTLKEVL